MEVAQRNSLACHEFIEIRILIALLIRVSIVQKPLLTRQVSDVTVDCHDVRPDDLEFSRLIRIEVELFAMGRMIGPRKNVIGIAPDKVGSFAVWIKDVGIFAVSLGCNQASDERIGSRSVRPPMQETELRPVGREQKMVEPLLRSVRSLVDVGMSVAVMTDVGDRE